MENDPVEEHRPLQRTGRYHTRYQDDLGRYREDSQHAKGTYFRELTQTPCTDSLMFP